VKSNRLRRWIARLVILFVASVVALFLAEVGVRIALPDYNPKSQLALEIQPSGIPLGPRSRTVRQATSKGDYDIQMSFNALGLRDARDWREAPANALVALGDSTTVGYGVVEKERFSNQLEVLLGEPVYNVGMPENLIGYQRFLDYIESQGPAVKRMIVGISMETDLQDYSVGKTAAEMQGKNTGLRLWFQTHSAFYLFASHSIQANATLRAFAERTGIANVRSDGVSQNPDDERILISSRDQLARLIAGREATILIIPSRALWKGGGETTERKVHGRFVAMLREAGMKVVDMLPRLERDGRPLDFFFVTDAHWNARGHRAAAEELAAALRR